MAGSCNERISRSAKSAAEQGMQALRSGNGPLAISWFGRAARLLPGDPWAPYSLATALARDDPVGALSQLDKLVAKHPTHRDARVLQVALFFRTGRMAQAARRLDYLLCNFGCPSDEGFRDLACAVCSASGYVGWVGVTGDGKALFAPSGLSLRLGPRVLEAVPAGIGQRTLPHDWRKAGRLFASVAGGVLLGARIDVGAISRGMGVVWSNKERALCGWVATPADPDTPVRVAVYAADGRLITEVIARDALPQPGLGAAQSYGFRIELPEPAPDVVHVRTADGTALMGSPLDWVTEAWACRSAALALAAGNRAAAWRPLPVSVSNLPSPHCLVPATRPIDVIIPLYRGADFFAACLASLDANRLPGMRIVAIDDGINDPRLRRMALAAAARKQIHLLRHGANRGFPAAANTGLRHAIGRDVLLLNSDTLLPPNAISRLAKAAYAAPDIGTVTPMTTDGSITSRHRNRREPLPSLAQLVRMDAEISVANAGLAVPIPCCVGFCAFIRHDCLAETGLFREDAFRQGYGEETDFSLRATHLGWQHVADTSVLVAHAGGASFGAVAFAQSRTNQLILERLHPGFAASVRNWLEGDALCTARFNADAALWKRGRKPRSHIMVSHSRGGGVARMVNTRAQAFRNNGVRPIILQPISEEGRGTSQIRFTVSEPGANTCHLTFPDVRSLADFLRHDRPRVVEFHHIADHRADIVQLPGLLSVPFDVFLHDYFAVCPQVTFCSTPGNFCGQPDELQTCQDCVADHKPPVEVLGSVETHRNLNAMMLYTSRRVFVPCTDMLQRLLKYVPQLTPIVTPWESDAALTRGIKMGKVSYGAVVHIAVVGGINQDKGYSVLLACARDAARRQLPLKFTVIGHTIDDDRLLATGRVFVTGRYTEGEAADLLRATAPDRGFVPSVWPETWCFALSELWQAGLHVTAFDIGAPAERIKASPKAGVLLPLAVNAAEINQHFISTVTSRIA